MATIQNIRSVLSYLDMRTYVGITKKLFQKQARPTQSGRQVARRCTAYSGWSHIPVPYRLSVESHSACVWG